MNRNILPLMFFAAFGLLALAIAIDCVRLADDARARVHLADDELKKHEDRLATLLSSSPQVTPEVTSAIQAYRTTAEYAPGYDAFQAMVASFQKTMANKIDPTNPLDRKFMDDIAGAINRHQVAAKPYDEELANYRAYLASWRGQIARWFSSNARADANDMITKPAT